MHKLVGWGLLHLNGRHRCDRWNHYNWQNLHLGLATLLLVLNMLLWLLMLLDGRLLIVMAACLWNRLQQVNLLDLAIVMASVAVMMRELGPSLATGAGHGHRHGYWNWHVDRY